LLVDRWPVFAAQLTESPRSTAAVPALDVVGDEIVFVEVLFRPAIA
jgi:hypothetical protein